jgi:outer membrane protein OmpA-like peptidoglycan-associated protein
MKKIVITLLFVVSILTLQAQLKLRVADKYFKELAYYKAVELYQDLAESKKSNTYILRRTAESYRLLNQNQKAEIWYAKLINSNEYTKDDIYHYAQVLKRNKKYEQANEWMLKLYQISPNNSIAKEHKANTTYFTDLLKDSTKFLMVGQPGINSDESDFAPWLYDSTTIIFTSSRRNTSMTNKKFGWDGSYFLDIYTSKIDDSKQIKEVKPYLENDFRSKYHEGPISFSNENQRMYITRSNIVGKKVGKSSENINNLKLFISEKENDEWQPLESFEYNNDEYSIGQASLSKDGKRMFFVSDMPGSLGETDLWETHLEGDKWTKPVNLGYRINTEGKEMYPYYHEESGLLFFASEGHVGLGGLDIYVASPDENGGFTNVENVGYPINTNSDDFGLILTDKEGVYGYFSSNRNGGKGSDDIYAVNIYEPFSSKIKMELLVANYETKEGLSRSTVIIYNITDQEQEELATDDQGKISYNMSRNKDYKIVAKLPTYNSDSITYSTVDLPITTEEVRKTIYLKQPSNYSINGSAIDLATNEKLDNYKVSLINIKTGEERITETQSNSHYYFNLNKDEIKDLRLTFEKEGYVAYNIDLSSFEFISDKPTIIDGLLSKTGIRIDNIYYDYDKSNIRKDAEPALNELAELLKQYPNMKIELGSHTDSRASESYNQALSQRRAKSAVDYLINKGIDKNRLSWKGYGETQLVNKCSSFVECSEEEHQLNRRTEFKIVE